MPYHPEALILELQEIARKRKPVAAPVSGSTQNHSQATARKFSQGIRFHGGFYPAAAKCKK